MSERFRVVRYEPAVLTGGMALIGEDGRALAFTRGEDRQEIASAMMERDATIKALADALEAARPYIPNLPWLEKVVDAALVVSGRRTP